MVGVLAAHHGDTASLTSSDLFRDAFGPHPWLRILVAESDRELIGYAALCGLAQLQFGSRGLDIHHLFTEGAFRGQGVGRSLVGACRIKAIELSCRYVTVGTHPSNHDAQSFYEKLGFTRKDGHPPRFSMRLDE